MRTPVHIYLVRRSVIEQVEASTDLFPEGSQSSSVKTIMRLTQQKYYMCGVKPTRVHLEV